MFFRNRHGQDPIRAVSAALVFTFALLLTPCCEVFAALPDTSTPAHSDTAHDHHDDGNLPPTGGHCAPWFEQAFMPMGDAALLSPGPAGMDVPHPYPLPAAQFSCLVGVVPHAGAPPPARAVYLLTSRLLL